MKEGVLWWILSLGLLVSTGCEKKPMGNLSGPSDLWTCGAVNSVKIDTITPPNGSVIRLGDPYRVDGWIELSVRGIGYALVFVRDDGHTYLPTFSFNSTVCPVRLTVWGDMVASNGVYVFGKGHTVKLVVVAAPEIPSDRQTGVVDWSKVSTQIDTGMTWKFE